MGLHFSLCPHRNSQELSGHAQLRQNPRPRCACTSKSLLLGYLSQPLCRSVCALQTHHQGATSLVRGALSTLALALCSPQLLTGACVFHSIYLSGGLICLGCKSPFQLGSWFAGRWEHSRWIPTPRELRKGTPTHIAPTQSIQKGKISWGCNAGQGPLPQMCKDLGLTPRTTKERKKIEMTFLRYAIYMLYALPHGM